MTYTWQSIKLKNVPMNQINLLLIGPYHCNDFEMVYRVTNKMIQNISKSICIIALERNIAYWNELVIKYANAMNYDIVYTNCFEDAIKLADIAIVFDNGISHECKEAIKTFKSNDMKYKVYLFKDEDWI